MIGDLRQYSMHAFRITFKCLRGLLADGRAIEEGRERQK